MEIIVNQRSAEAVGKYSRLHFQLFSELFGANGTNEFAQGVLSRILWGGSTTLSRRSVTPFAVTNTVELRNG